MFRKLSDDVYASAQITVGDLARASQQGITLVVNNRPEGEDPDQTAGAVIEQAARELGIDYVAVPVTHAGFSEWQVDALADALASAKGPVLAYCRSGTRSTLLWALARAKTGGDPAAIAEAAAAAGYDIAPVRPLVDMLASGRDAPRQD